MRIFVLLALAFLPALCHADPIDVTNYQMNITATWIETNPACVSNCTENMNISYVFELNNSFNTGTSEGLGWVEMNTLKESSSGFLGSFSPTTGFPASGLWEDDGGPSADGLPFYNTLLSANGYSDEIDLGKMGPGVVPSENYADMYIYDCFSETCQNAYSGPYEYIRPNTESSTAVQVPAGDTGWELTIASMFFCAAGLWVKHRQQGRFHVS
jgi:hypothetical protein